VAAGDQLARLVGRPGGAWPSSAGGEDPRRRSRKMRVFSVRPGNESLVIRERFAKMAAIH